MTHSEQINEIAAALSKAQAVIAGAVKDSVNPHYKASYADLASVWDACRKPLTDHGLSVVQTPAAGEDGRLSLTTMLLHASGQWISDVLVMKPTKDDPQGVGSCITYARRYALAAMVGVAPEDDDGNAASAKAAPKVAATMAPAKPAGFDAWMLNLADAADDGLGSLEAAWKAAKPEHRSYLTTIDNARWLAMKAHAAKPHPVGA